MMLVDATKRHVFIWTPGTGGHEVHPNFKKAVDMICQGDAQIIVVDYPAEWNMEESVPEGVRSLTAVLKRVNEEYDPETQNVYLAGSSQGSWVISEVADDSDLMAPVTKTVLFGHPGLAENHDHHYDEDDTLWEINHPDDAVTFGWAEDREKLIESFSKAQRLNPKAVAYLLWMCVRHPIRLFRFIYLIFAQKGWVWWNSSPHDYSNIMPMAVYWMIH
jgi:hypothetical protein